MNLIDLNTNSVERQMKLEKYFDGQDKEKSLIYDLQFMPSGTTLDSKVRCKKCGKECDELRQNFGIIQ